MRDRHFKNNSDTATDSVRARARIGVVTKGSAGDVILSFMMDLLGALQSM